MTHPPRQLILSLSHILLLLLCLLNQGLISAATATTISVSLTRILDKNGQHTTFITLLTTTEIASLIQHELKNSPIGLTVLAPTDTAFDNLKYSNRSINSLGIQGQIPLVYYHVLPRFYNLSDLLWVTNPIIKSKATGYAGGLCTLKITGQANQVHVSTGIVETQIKNALIQEFPLGVFQVDEVLLPVELFGLIISSLLYHLILQKHQLMIMKVMKVHIHVSMRVIRSLIGGGAYLKFLMEESRCFSCIY
ncbi:hypothetical protein LWI28_026182 [Acer negundo]|uniref:FAS1 domain-containing protein n=1 Tax=Acer negundo TaxID=4023 RepID=A0AAD5IX98_ACENE|nr:hypothetical protein LWI28_026182 [Acer negundo]KAK4847126.1 hypothetical protein QYF36_025906 [Acer negundo]